MILKVQIGKQANINYSIVNYSIGYDTLTLPIGRRRGII